MTQLSSPVIFDKRRLMLHRRRASENFLLHGLCERLADRLQDVTRRFSSILDLSAQQDILAQYITPHTDTHDITYATLDEEVIHASREQYDLVMSAGALHWVNDVPGLLSQIKQALTPEGLFLAIFPGGETLKELRAAFECTELALYGGISPRVSPFIDVRDAGSLLQRAGFSLPVVDSETITITYTHPLKLLHDLRYMGQANTLISSQKTMTSRTLMMQMCEQYLRDFSTSDGRIHATFEMISMTGWK